MVTQSDFTVEPFLFIFLMKKHLSELVLYKTYFGKDRSFEQTWSFGPTLFLRTTRNARQSIFLNLLESISELIR